MLNLELNDGKAVIKIYTTGEYPGATVTLSASGKTLFSETVDFSPEMSYEKEVETGNVKKEELTVSLFDKSGKTLVSYTPEPGKDKPVPDPADPAPYPEDVSSTEQLYLWGLHLEQYRHATYNPVDYYAEALKREPGNIRNNNAMGLWLMRKGQLEKAEPYFRKAIETLTERNPNPYDGEPLYNLGLCLQFQGKYDEAYDRFFKATWNSAWQDSGFFHVAQIDALRGDFEKALELIDNSLNRNVLNQKARHMKTVLLRKSGRKDEALRYIEETLNLDKFNFGVLYEKYLLTDDKRVLEELKELMRGYVHNFIEFSLDYAAAGFYDEAEQFILEAIDDGGSVYPMVYYLAGWFASLKGDEIKAKEYFEKGSQMPSDYCFPNRTEEMLALKTAIGINPADPKAPYYLGNYWYGNRQYAEAIDNWEKSVSLDDSFPTAHRNLALAYFNKQNKPEKALKALEKAFSLDTSDARVFMELDQLCKKLNRPVEFRLENLEKHLELVMQRDDLYLERLTLLILKGEEDKALELLMSRKFHPWEGGEGKVTGQFLYSHLQLAKKDIRNGDYRSALEHLDATASYPHNLGEGKLYGALENDIQYWKGVALALLEEEEKAEQEWQKAASGSMKPAISMYYNDQHPDKIFYQGLALKKLGKTKEAENKFKELLDFGLEQLSIPFKMDFFAVSLPDLLIFEEDMQKRHETECRYLIGLGYLGLGETGKAKEELHKVLDSNLWHQGARVHLDLI